MSAIMRIAVTGCTKGNDDISHNMWVTDVVGVWPLLGGQGREKNEQAGTNGEGAESCQKYQRIQQESGQGDP